MLKYMVQVAMGPRKFPDPFRKPVLDVSDILLVSGFLSMTFHVCPDGTDDLCRLVNRPRTRRSVKKCDSSHTIIMDIIDINLAICDDS